MDGRTKIFLHMITDVTAHNIARRLVEPTTVSEVWHPLQRVNQAGWVTSGVGGFVRLRAYGRPT